MFKKCILFLIFFAFFSACSEVITGIPTVRKSTIAGSFYPNNKRELSKLIDSYLQEVPDSHPEEAGEIWGIVAPHAGYPYSGKIAAYAYKQIKDKPLKTVVILASSHYVRYSGVAIYPSGIWETPLGSIKVDTETANFLMEKASFLKVFPAPFFPEHSIEAQLPFLQKTLQNFKIVPILFGQEISENEYKRLSDALFTLIKNRPGEVLIVASSDLSHYHEYSRAKIMDNIAIKNILSLDIERLRTNLEQRNCEMCGASAVITIMKVAEQLPTKVVLLKYANSGDTMGERSSVVGYSAIAFYITKTSNLVNSEEQRTLLKIARRTLESFVLNGEIPEFDTVDGNLTKKAGLFVTLKKGNQLRGCIGTILPEKPMKSGVVEMTIASASRDQRFPKVQPEELSEITIEISLLSPLKRVENIEEIEIGKHGLYLCKGLRCGVLLPQVAVENKWDREEFLKMVCLKAGLPPSAWKDSDSELYTFTAQVFSE